MTTAARLSTSWVGVTEPVGGGGHPPMPASVRALPGPLKTAVRARSRIGRWLVLLLVLATVGACTTTTTSSTAGPDSSGTPSTATSSRSTTESAASATTAAMSPSTASLLPSASSGGALVRTCANGSVQPLAASSADATAGPLVFPNVKLVGSAGGLSNFYGGGQVPDGPGGSKFYKMGTLVKVGATVTVTVARSARSYLRLQQGPGPHLEGQMSVVFQACPGSSYTGWVGGFDITGPLPACVALDVQVAGEQILRHLAIPFGAATCPT